MGSPCPRRTPTALLMVLARVGITEASERGGIVRMGTAGKAAAARTLVRQGDVQREAANEADAVSCPQSGLGLTGDER